MPHIFGTMPHIFCTMPHIFGTVLHIFCTVPHILGIARTAATRFQMQGAINSNRSLTFRRAAEEGDLRQAYNMSANCGYLTPQHYAALADKMGVPVTTVKNWYNEERKAKGHMGNFLKGKPPAVEVRTRLPLTRDMYTFDSEGQELTDGMSDRTLPPWITVGRNARTAASDTPA